MHVTSQSPSGTAVPESLAPTEGRVGRALVWSWIVAAAWGTSVAVQVLARTVAANVRYGRPAFSELVDCCESHGQGGWDGVFLLFILALFQAIPVFVGTTPVLVAYAWGAPRLLRDARWLDRTWPGALIGTAVLAAAATAAIGAVVSLAGRFRPYQPFVFVHPIGAWLLLWAALALARLAIRSLRPGAFVAAASERLR